MKKNILLLITALFFCLLTPCSGNDTLTVDGKTYEIYDTDPERPIILYYNDTFEEFWSIEEVIDFIRKYLN